PETYPVTTDAVLVCRLGSHAQHIGAENKFKPEVYRLRAPAEI
ncbi:MAG: hypothetical protein RL497_1342, partial [Pseudomonadota bacterium]